MVKVQQKASWDASSLSGSDSDDSSSGSSSKNSSRSNNEESSSDSSEPSSAKNERLKSFSDNHFRDTGNGDMGNKMREKDDYRYSTRPSKQDGGGSKAESEDLTPEINNGAYKWPGQVRRSQRLPNDIENQYETEDSRRAIKKRTLTEESSHLSDETPENLDDKPIEEKPRLPTRERKIITCLTLFLTCLCLLATLGIGIAIGLASAKDESSLSRGVDPALVPTTPPTRSQTTPTVAPQAPSSNSPLETFKPTEDTLLDLLIANSFDDGATLLTAGTPQRSAYEWLSQNTNITEYADDVKLARYALATFYFSTNGPTTWDEEIREGAWMTDAPECEWATTASNQCSDNAYTSLTLDFVGVSGQIPEELALLTGLTRLSIRSEGVGSPSLSGSLPESIGMLENLETIRLNENNIGGVLPTTIGGLSNIRVFLLGGNSIGGTIPSEIGLTGGNTFNFDRNELSGKLPPELFAMETLTALNFEENSLSGTIPTEIGLNPSLNSVNFASNRLTGTIPSEIGSLVTARAGINLSNNELSGSLPSEIGFLVGMQNFLVHNNRLVGTVPTQYRTLSDMRLFRLDGNSFTGFLPEDVCDSFTDRTVSYADCATTDFDCECCTYCCNEDACTCNTDDEQLCTEIAEANDTTQEVYIAESKVSNGNKRDTSRRK